MVSVHMGPPVWYAVLSEGSRNRYVSAVHEPGPPGPPKPRLIDRMRQAIDARHYSGRTEKARVRVPKRHDSPLDEV